MRIELLYFDGCPGFAELRPRLERLLAERRLDDHLELVAVMSVEQAEAQRFLGSPSVRMNGHDVEPSADEREDFGMKCRTYPRAGRMGHAPTDEQIVAALDRAG